MIPLSATELAGLRLVAAEIRESMEESSFQIDAAVGQHEAFSQSQRPASELERALIKDAARRGASRAGIGYEQDSGSLDLITSSGNTLRRFRVKKLTVNLDGRFVGYCGIGSSLLASEPESLMRDEKWLLGYVTAEDHTIDHLIAAEVVGWEGNSPVRLLLGPAVSLDQPQSPLGFVSTDEGLAGFDDSGEGSGTSNAV